MKMPIWRMMNISMKAIQTPIEPNRCSMFTFHILAMDAWEFPAIISIRIQSTGFSPIINSLWLQICYKFYFYFQDLDLYFRLATPKTSLITMLKVWECVKTILKIPLYLCLLISPTVDIIKSMSVFNLRHEISVIWFYEKWTHFDGEF